MNKAIILLSLAAGIGLGYLLFGLDTSEPASQAAEQPLFYRNPMNPEITSPVPAKGSMGMDYIPVFRDSQASAGTVKIDPTVQHNIGLRTASAERKSISRTIRTLGRVDYNEERLFRLHPKVEGWIKQIRIDKTGQPVSADDILLSIYSPKLVSTQQEYLLALRNLETMSNSGSPAMSLEAKALAHSSRVRLSLLDVPEHQIRELEESQQIKQEMHLHAPAGGTVLKIGAREGQYVTPATELYLIADLNTVWVYADVYDYELPWVKQGDQVKMKLASVPGRIFSGAVAYIFPYAEPMTRTTRIRLAFDNPDRLLRPNMFAELNIRADTKQDQIVVPAEAIVRSGDYEQVFVMTEPGSFEPRRVEVGIESAGEVAILRGIAAGERVVVSAQFLIDSESNLREATAKMMQPESSADASTDASAETSTDAKPDRHEGMHHD